MSACPVLAPSPRPVVSRQLRVSTGVRDAPPVARPLRPRASSTGQARSDSASLGSSCREVVALGLVGAFAQLHLHLGAQP